MRLWARLHARLGGYFWLPCPVCGRMFGGHELAIDHGILHTPSQNMQGTCPRCPGDYMKTPTGRVVRARMRLDGDDKPMMIFEIKT